MEAVHHILLSLDYYLSLGGHRLEAVNLKEVCIRSYSLSSAIYLQKMHR